MNGQEFPSFIREILDRCSAETLPFKAVRFSWQQDFWWYLSGGCDRLETLELEYRDRAGQEGRRILPTVDFATFSAIKDAYHDGPVLRREGRGTSLVFYDEGRIAYLYYPAFRYTQQEMDLIDGIFRKICATGTRRLIIDIRGNGGGSSGMGDFIASYLTRKPFRTFSQMKVRISQESIEKNPWLARFQALLGMNLTWNFPETAPEPREAFFDGKTWLLVDNGTFSSASGFATVFRDYIGGTIVGYETGGLPTGFGDILGGSLRHSRIPLTGSYKHFVSSRNLPGDDEHGVLPHVAVTDELLRPYAVQEDPELEYTLDLIRAVGG